MHTSMKTTCRACSDPFEMGAEAADGAESTVAAETETRMGTFRPGAPETECDSRVGSNLRTIRHRPTFYLLKMIRAGGVQ